MKIKEVLNKNILNGLGDCWEIFFKDQQQMKAYVQANEYAMSRAYFKLIGMFLQNSLQDFPLFSEELWAPINLVFKRETFDEKQKFRDPLTGIDMQGYIVKLTHNLKGIHGIVNKIVYPDLNLTENYDYIIRELEIIENNQYIKAPCIVFKDNIFESEYINKKQLDDQWQMHLWGKKVQYESTDFYDMYGRFVADFVPNKDSYKAFVEGLWYFYVKGPTVKRIETAINLLMGFPVIRYENEEIMDIQISQDLQKIITNKSIYILRSSAELQDSITIGAKPTLFAPIAKAVTIDDYISTPNWWDGFYLSTADYDPTGTPNEGLDREMKLDDGSGDPNASFEIFDKYLKYNRFNIVVDVGAALYANNVNDLIDVIGPGLPLYIDYYFGLVYNFEDNATDDLSSEEDLVVNTTQAFVDHFFANSNAWFFGYGHETQAMWYFLNEEDTAMMTWGELEAGGFQFSEEIGYDSEYKGAFFLDHPVVFSETEPWNFEDDSAYDWGDGDSTVIMPYRVESTRNQFGYDYTENESGYSYGNFRFLEEQTYDFLEMDFTTDFEERNGFHHIFSDDPYWYFGDLDDFGNPLTFNEAGYSDYSMFDCKPEFIITDDIQESVISTETLDLNFGIDHSETFFEGLYFLEDNPWIFEDVPELAFSDGKEQFSEDNPWTFSDIDPTLFEYARTFSDDPTWFFGDLNPEFNVKQFLDPDESNEDLDLAISMDFNDEAAYAPLQYIEGNPVTFSETSPHIFKEYFEILEECTLEHYDPDLGDPTSDPDYVKIII